jgi:hypothetical protein
VVLSSTLISVHTAVSGCSRPRLLSQSDSVHDVGSTRICSELSAALTFIAVLVYLLLHVCDAHRFGTPRLRPAVGKKRVNYGKVCTRTFPSCHQ